jgi:hypothetical protein
MTATHSPPPGKESVGLSRSDLGPARRGSWDSMCCVGLVLFTQAAAGSQEGVKAVLVWELTQSGTGASGP